MYFAGGFLAPAGTAGTLGPATDRIFWYNPEDDVWGELALTLPAAAASGALWISPETGAFYFKPSGSTTVYRTT